MKLVSVGSFRKIFEDWRIRARVARICLVKSLEISEARSVLVKF